MEYDVASIMDAVMPVIKTIIFGGFGIAVCGALAYVLFVVKKRKKWIINIWEQKANGRLFFVGKDLLVAKKFNFGKQVAYLLKRNKSETIPPPDECVDKINNKEYANYLRILDDYIPLKREINFPDEYREWTEDKVTGKKKNKFSQRIKNAIGGIKHMTSNDVENRYIFAPLNKMLVGELHYKPIEFDVNMMRINALDNREKIYRDTQDWISKYGQYVALGAIIVLIIVVLYLSYDYSQNVLQQSFGAAQSVSGPLQQIAERLS